MRLLNKLYKSFPSWWTKRAFCHEKLQSPSEQGLSVTTTMHMECKRSRCDADRHTSLRGGSGLGELELLHWRLVAICKAKQPLVAHNARTGALSQVSYRDVYGYECEQHTGVAQVPVLVDWRWVGIEVVLIGESVFEWARSSSQRSKSSPDPNSVPCNGSR